MIYDQEDPITAAVRHQDMTYAYSGPPPTDRYAQDVAGMPCFAADRDFHLFVGAESMKGNVPRDDENCALALGCRVQLQTPYVSVGRARTDIALPHGEGVVKPGYGSTKWAVIRFENSPGVRRVVIAADTGRLGEAGAWVTFKPVRTSNRPGRPGHTRDRKPKGVADGRGVPKGNGQDKLTLAGVRKLTGQRRR